MSRASLPSETVRENLTGLEGWALEENGKAITRTFRFKSFSEAFAFMTRTALVAEKLDHHPDWTNSFRTVSVRLSTHDAGGLTALDFELAHAMNRLAPPA